MSLTHARQGPSGIEPYPTRQQIEEGALEGIASPILYLADPVDAFFLHVQGSGLIELDDGDRVRIGYDGKNGHPYSSVGRYIISLGAMTAEEATLDSIKDWLKADARRGREAMWQNASYIFFRELGPASETATLGVRNIPLTAGRSLAVDAECHELGLPVFVVAPELDPAGLGRGTFRLMMSQDVGSAIRGPERGDLFYGVGDEAGRLAGTTKHRGNFFVLMPKPAGTT